ncbi:MAG: hypothetical protein ACK40R_00275 [Thermomonas sp.]
MGQAKLRGTFEQRAAEAQKRADEERAERDRKEAEAQEAERQRIAAMPQEQRVRFTENKRRRQMNVATIIAIGAAFGARLPSHRGKA